MSAIPESSEPIREVGYKKPPVHTQFQKGQSGNPGGRPKDSAKTVRERLEGSPAKLAEWLEEIACDPKARNADRISAIRELWSRGWGLPASFTSIEGQDPLGLSDLDSEIQAIADELSKRRAA